MEDIRYQAISEINRVAYDSLAIEYKSRIETYKILAECRATVVPFIKLVTSKFGKGSRVLEIGPGSGLDILDFCSAGFETTGIDISANMIDVAKETSPKSMFINDDFLKHDFDCDFHGVFARAFIHLFPKCIAIDMLNKMKRILVDGGVLFLGTTEHDHSSESVSIKEDYNSDMPRYRKRWTRAELESCISDVGMKTEKIYYHRESEQKNWIMLIATK
jgi:SAM-dependent methyltransferase